MLTKAATFLFLAGLTAASAPASPIQLQLTGANGAVAFGYYVGPYYAQYGSQAVSVFCDDFANDAYFGETWQANQSTITAGSDLSNTRYGGVTNALQDYQEIAWLDTQFAVAPTSEYGNIHATIWDIFDPAEAPKPASSYWQTQAQANYQSISYADFRVLTNVGPVAATGQVQEFLVITTPEPVPFILIACGLFSFIWWRKRTQGACRS